MEAIARTSLSGAPPGAALAAVMFAAAVHLIAPRPAAAGMGTLAPLDFNDRATNHVNYGGDSPVSWGHHSGRYD